LGVVLIYFIVTIVRHQRRNIRLYKSKILAEITTLEKERARIASDLHDELGPILSAVKFKINSLDIHNDEDQNLLDKSNKNIDEIIRRMREISNDLLPKDSLLQLKNRSITLRRIRALT
jgi:signal transduction histidine kinase